MKQQNGSRSIKAEGYDLKRRFRDIIWVTHNLSPKTRHDLNAIGSHLAFCGEMLDLSSETLLPVDLWCEFRENLTAALAGTPSQQESMLQLAEVVQRHQIPQQFLFDMIRASDYWIRFGGFDRWEQLEKFASDFAGSATLAACCVIGVRRAGFEEAALDCGSAILLTRKLARCVSDLKANRNFLAQEDLQRFRVDLSRVKMRQHSSEFSQFVRFTVARIEKLFMKGGRLFPYLELDGRRSLTSLLSLHWQLLVRMKLQPECLFEETDLLKRSQIRGMKFRHLMGTEGGLPFVESDAH